MFRLPPQAPVGSYLRVVLHGKCQQQLEDLQYYIAMRYVAAHGTALSAHELVGLDACIRSSHLALRLAKPPSAAAAGRAMGGQPQLLHDGAAAGSSGQSSEPPLRRRRTNEGGQPLEGVSVAAPNSGGASHSPSQPGTSSGHASAPAPPPSQAGPSSSSGPSGSGFSDPGAATSSSRTLAAVPSTSAAAPQGFAGCCASVYMSRKRRAASPADGGGEQRRSSACEAHELSDDAPGCSSDQGHGERAGGRRRRVSSRNEGSFATNACYHQAVAAAAGGAHGQPGTAAAGSYRDQGFQERADRSGGDSNAQTSSTAGAATSGGLSAIGRGGLSAISRGVGWLHNFVRRAPRSSGRIPLNPFPARGSAAQQQQASDGFGSDEAGGPQAASLRGGLARPHPAPAPAHGGQGPQVQGRVQPPRPPPPMYQLHIDQRFAQELQWLFPGEQRTCPR